MSRRTVSKEEKSRLAKQASARGDEVVARESGWKKDTIAQWRRDRNLPAKGNRTVSRPKEVPASAPLTPALVGALDIDTTEERLLPSVAGLSLEQRRELADRTVFPLDVKARREWEEMNRQPAQDLPDLRAFMQRRSPYINYDSSLLMKDIKRTLDN